MTDDGQRCALEYNCYRWGSQALTPQAGLAVYERGAGGRLAAVRIYDDIEPPFVVAAAPRSMTKQVKRGPEDAAERELFETIKSTYSLALEPELHAMVTELRDQLRSIPDHERRELISEIQAAIGRNQEEEFEFLG